MAALIVAAVNELGGLLDALDAAEQMVAGLKEGAADLLKEHGEHCTLMERAADEIEAKDKRLATLERENAQLREIERLVRYVRCCDGDDAKQTDEIKAALRTLDTLRASSKAGKPSKGGGDNG